MKDRFSFIYEMVKKNMQLLDKGEISVDQAKELPGL
jgi:hypothetical protein